MKIAFLFTCYNRRLKTKACLDSIIRAMSYCATRGIEIEDSWYITDAGSSDGTVEMLKNIIDTSKMHLRVENDNVFYSVGMRMCMEMFLDDYGNRLEKGNADYCFLINDDVEFYEDYLYRMCESADKNSGCAIVGATDFEGKQTYGGVRYINGVNRKFCIPQSIRYEMVSVNDACKDCHTFNANCVMIPGNVVSLCGAMDRKYMHSLGDFDYGLCIYDKGVKIVSTGYFVGSCSNNSKSGGWMDRSLPRRERIRKLNSVKGAPTKYWFYYLKKHFGLATALVHSISPYIRVGLGR